MNPLKLHSPYRKGEKEAAYRENVIKIISITTIMTAMYAMDKFFYMASVPAAYFINPSKLPSYKKLMTASVIFIGGGMARRVSNNLAFHLSYNFILSLVFIYTTYASLYSILKMGESYFYEKKLKELCE